MEPYKAKKMPFGTQALAGYAATMRVENVFSLMFVSIGNAVSPYVSQNLGANKTSRIKKGYRAALLLDTCFAALAFIVIETLHTQISSFMYSYRFLSNPYTSSGIGGTNVAVSMVHPLGPIQFCVVLI
jgi:Na+-driven multidrug efflux pump